MNAPVILAKPRPDGAGLMFYCDFCRKTHYHGEGSGHRGAHCWDSKSPYHESGYVLEEVRG